LYHPYINVVLVDHSAADGVSATATFSESTVESEHMQGRWVTVVGAFVTILLLGGLLALFTVSLTPAARFLLVFFLGILAMIGIAAGGFVWWVRRELGPSEPSETVQQRLEERIDEGEN